MTNTCCGPLKSSGDPIEMRSAYWYILQTFPNLKRAPTIEEIEKDLFFRRDTIIDILNSLVSKGALRIEPASYAILDAYPYSGVPTRHRVYLDHEKGLYSMCAVDTFYIPFLTESNVMIRSRCFQCRAEIEIVLKQEKISVAKPAQSIIWNSTAAYDCPKTNFFCSQEHLLKWRENAPDEQGQFLTLPAALSIGKEAVNRMKRSREDLNDILWAKADELVCYCREVPKATIVAAISRGAASVEEIAKETMACTGGWCQDANPRKRCCCVEIEALLEVYAK
jgi:hypothetical protein